MLACYEFTINSHGFTGSKKNRKADLFQAYATMIILSGHWFVRLPLCIIRVTRLLPENLLSMSMLIGLE
jgi:hypothetical protein